MKAILNAALTLCFACATATAQELTDVTSQYLQNPSFELDDISSLPKDATRGAYTATSLVGWTLTAPTSGYAVSDIMTADATATDNNFGRPGSPSDGNQMYYMRNSWTANTASLQQTVTLPAGQYRLTVDNKCVSGAAHTAKLIASNEQTSLSFQSSMPSAWETATVDFKLTKETAVSVGLTVNFINGSGGSLLIDNFRLYKFADDYTPPAEPTEKDVTSFTEGVINGDFVSEKEMMDDLLKMLASFSLYMKNDFYDCQAPNSINEVCGYFNGESSGQANEAGVRTNADLSMLCAFLVKYAKPAGVQLPAGVTWERIEEMAMKSLVFAYSTHKANKLKVCAGSTQYWGSTSNSDKVWESSLWAMSVAYSAYFQWDKLTADQKNYIYKMLKAECNYELQRTIPTGYNGDTKAEENGWEADVLAVALGLFPNDELAPRWFERLREFAINSYSHYADAQNNEVLDPHYDSKTVADLYKGNNLYGDYTLQNHNLFHTSYQNVVMQELGEAALAMQLFQQTTKPIDPNKDGDMHWCTRALMHNNQKVMDEVLNWLALTDGELAMPNGNDWSLFLYDQITSYSTQACFQRDPNALMLENLAYKYIKARQQTTNDGSWLLRPDVSARRMGVEGHRVMMTYLMHLANSTADLTPTSWEDFRAQHSEAKVLPYQNVVRAFTKDRFTCFSWSDGLKSYTGYFASNSVDKNKIVVPYRANNTGNITGFYTVSGKGTNATPVVKGIYDLQGDAYVMNGELNTNDNTLNNRFAIYSTAGNAVIYLDDVKALAAATITGEQGGMLAISTDELTKLQRTLYYGTSETPDTRTSETSGISDTRDSEILHKQLDGKSLTTFNTDWINIDNELGVVGQNDKQMAFGDRSANNSIYTAKLYPMYGSGNRNVKSGETIDRRNLVYYSNIDAATTAEMNSALCTLTSALPEGWNGVIAADPDGTNHLLVSNFRSTTEEATVSNIACKEGAPVFSVPTTITADGKASATFSIAQNHSVGNCLKAFIKGINATAVQTSPDSIYITPSPVGADLVSARRAARENPMSARIWFAGKTANVSMKSGETYLVTLENGEIKAEAATLPSALSTQNLVRNPGFDEGTTYWTGSPTINNSAAEKYNTTFNVYQKITGLQPGRYVLRCQGFYRNGGYAAAATARTAGNEKLLATLYAQSSKEKASKPLASIFEEAGKVGTVGVNQQPYGYIPNTMAEASFYFLAGLYPNELEVTVPEDGELTIGIEKTQAVNSDWTIFDSFSLTRIETPNAIKQTTHRPFADADTYTISGVRVSETNTPGVYIKNGKKVVVGR